MEAEASGTAPEGVAHEVLRKQSTLLSRQSTLTGWQIASERAGFALKVLAGLAGTTAAVLLAMMVWSAAQDRSLIIDPVGAPEDMVKQGATGEALAHALQDKLAALQADTRSVFISAQLRDRDTGDLKVMIPQTGVSLVELNQALREWLGHQTHITGEVSRPTAGPEAGALVLATRVGTRPGQRLVQKDGDLDALLSAAAERLYAEVDPLRHALWLNQHGRQAEAVAEFQRLSTSGSDLERAQALNLWGTNGAPTDTVEQRRDRLAQAVRLSNGKVGLNNLAGTETVVGHAEAAYQGYLKTQREAPWRRNPALTEDGRRGSMLVLVGNVTSAVGDFNAALARSCWEFDVASCSGPALARTVQARPDLTVTSRVGDLRLSAAWLAGLHDVSSAATLLAAPRREQSSASQQATQEAFWLTAAMRLDLERHDWPSLLRNSDAYEAIVAVYPSRRSYSFSGGMTRALAQAGLGDWAGAKQTAAALPADCYHCLIVRGRLSAMKKDWRGADVWFAEAARQGPSLPFAETEWGRTLIEQGKSDAAIAKLSAAHRKGPKFADPLAYWGEALLAKGNAKGAAAKFAQASAFAPQWGRLHLKWGQALSRQGKAAEASAQFAQATALHLTPAERAELQGVTQKRTN